MGKSRILLILTVIGSLLCSPLQAQEAAKGRIYEIKDFSGGLSTKPASISLPSKNCTIAENIRFGDELNSFTKRVQLLSYGSADTTEAITGMHRLYLSDGTQVLVVSHGDEIEAGNDSTGAFTTILDLTTGDYQWQFVTWHDLLIGCDGYNNPIKWDGSSASATYLGACLATDAGEGAGPNGTYTYTVSFYTASYEVSLGATSNAVTVVDNDIDLTMIPIGPDTYGGEDVVGRKVYRIANGGSDYKLLSNGTIANNTATTLTDSDADGALGAELSPDATYQPPKGKFAVVHKNRLWFGNDPSYPSRLYYSNDGSQDVFDSDDYFNVRANDGDSITFLKNFMGILTIGKNNHILKLYTDRVDPDADWEISDPFSEIGCSAPYTAAVTPVGILYLSLDGLYRFNGQNSFLISDDVTPEIQDIATTNYTDCWGVYHRNMYYMAYTSSDSGEAFNNRVLVYDLATKAYSMDITDINAFCVFNAGTDWGVLYSGSSVSGTVYANSWDSYAIVHKKHDDFTGTFDDARYIPTGAGGDVNDPVIEIAWTETIDELVGTIDTHSYGEDAIIDRPDTDGSYVSPTLYVGAYSLDKIYWNETIPGAGGNVTFQVRAGASAAACAAASWSTAVTDPTGSDISGTTAEDYIQYKINLTTTDIDYTPTVYKANNYVVKITYFKEATTTETSIPIHHKTGWLDFGLPGYKKQLRKLQIFYESESTGTLNVEFETFEGVTDTFEIDLTKYPSSYTEYFTNGSLLGELFTVDITESSMNQIKVKKLNVIYDVEPLK